MAANLAETTEPDTAALATAQRLATGEIDVEPLLAPALSGDAGAIAREAARLGVDATTLERLADLALQPVLWEAAAQLAALTEIDRWDRGYCPVCGAWPGLAELVGPEKRRVLRCLRCGSAWSWPLLLCPYCGNDDHRTLGILAEASAGERVDVCERCHGHLKAIQTYASHGAPRLVAEDAATLHLDMGAAEAGYKRPGDVDVAEAGIPRLVRDGLGEVARE